MFQPCEAGRTADVRVDAGRTAPDESHFFLAVCAHRPQMGNPTFVYIPQSANLLRERERHIALLAAELQPKNQWLDDLHREHEQLQDAHRRLQEELERGNQWAQTLDRELVERRARIVELQEELARVTAGYSAKVKELEQDVQERTRWALDLDTQLKEGVEALHRTEQDLETRTAWAHQLEEQTRRLQKLADQTLHLQQQLEYYRRSGWVKLGRKIGLGPDLSAR